MSARFSKPLLAVAFAVSFAFIGAQVPASAGATAPPPCTEDCAGPGHGLGVITGKCSDFPDTCAFGAPAIPHGSSTGGGVGDDSESESGSSSGPLIKLCLKECKGKHGSLIDLCQAKCTEP
jgi:hypothetical protein